MCTVLCVEKGKVVHKELGEKEEESRVSSTVHWPEYQSHTQRVKAAQEA